MQCLCCKSNLQAIDIFADKLLKMVRTGLEVLLNKFPDKLRGKRSGILCHAPSITTDYHHITEIFYSTDACKMTAIFGPQHGLFGETQDNMIEWTGNLHPYYKVPVFSLYGEHRKPTPAMLNEIDVLIVDLQDVGARLYTYAWTLKLCMEACTEAGIPIWVLDRPNPVAGLWYDGPVLKEEFFTFVGGASIPLCHRMTMGEIALWLKEKYIAKCDLNVLKMEGWNRSMMFDQTRLPWVLPSPNMPTLQSAVVYPGMVLFEALNVSEGRGTTIPFELFGAPFINSELLLNRLRLRNIPGCRFRVHNFIPTFNKFAGKQCNGLQLHVTDIRSFRPVMTAIEIAAAIMETSQEGSFRFNDPPYEYEYELMPFDILAGDDLTRKALLNGSSLTVEYKRWADETELFRKEFSLISLYPE
jgi:uncharacterized protein YbbC (DUF1343 family)